MRKDVVFKTQDGVMLRGWHYLPDQRSGKVPTIVMAHGFSAVKEMYLDKFAEVFAEAGLGALVFDNRNFGASGGEPRQEIDPWEQVRDYRDAITFVNEAVTTAMAQNQPVISVDTKKKELVGDFKNAGREWRPQGAPEDVRVHDFLIKELGRADIDLGARRRCVKAYRCRGSCTSPDLGRTWNFVQCHTQTPKGSALDLRQRAVWIHHGAGVHDDRQLLNHHRTAAAVGPARARRRRSKSAYRVPVQNVVAMPSPVSFGMSASPACRAARWTTAAWRFAPPTAFGAEPGVASRAIQQADAEGDRIGARHRAASSMKLSTAQLVQPGPIEQIMAQGFMAKGLHGSPRPCRRP